MTRILSVDGISVMFGGHIAVNKVSLQIPRGSVTGLIGPNGAGKTTLFNVVSGLLKPVKGSIYFDEKRITELPPFKRARIGLGRTFQRLELFNSLSVYDNIRVSVEIKMQWSGITTSSVFDITEELERVIEITGLDKVRNRMVSEIPTGQARLVELARSLTLSPKLLLLDEPASGLNEEETNHLGSVIRKLPEAGISIFLVEHDMSLVMSTCDLVHVLDFGSLIAQGTPEEIQEHEAVLEAYLGTDYS